MSCIRSHNVYQHFSVLPNEQTYHLLCFFDISNITSIIFEHASNPNHQRADLDVAVASLQWHQEFKASMGPHLFVLCP